MDTSGEALADYEVVDLSADWRVVKGLHLFGRVENLTDEDYVEVLVSTAPAQPLPRCPLQLLIAARGKASRCSRTPRSIAWNAAGNRALGLCCQRLTQGRLRRRAVVHDAPAFSMEKIHGSQRGL